VGRPVHVQVDKPADWYSHDFWDDVFCLFDIRGKLWPQQWCPVLRGTNRRRSNQAACSYDTWMMHTMEPLDGCHAELCWQKRAQYTCGDVPEGRRSTDQAFTRCGALNYGDVQARLLSAGYGCEALWLAYSYWRCRLDTTLAWSTGPCITTTAGIAGVGMMDVLLAAAEEESETLYLGEIG
jgi:hypothetical protein